MAKKRSVSNEGGGQCPFCWPSQNREMEWLNGKYYDAKILKRIHWYNQFTPTSLEKHLRENGFDVEAINDVLVWYDEAVKAVDLRRAQRS